MSTREKLGKGLESLLGGVSEARKATPQPQAIPQQQQTIVETTTQALNPADIKPNPYQPRETIAGASFQGLVDSISKNGILQPLVVRKSTQGIQLVAGERRLRAAIAAGLKTVPVVYKDFPDEKMLEIALIENIQREDLNPIEKAKGFRSMISRLGITQEEAAERIGIERSSLANFIRLLDLPPEMQDRIAEGTLSAGHARAILSLKEPELMQELFRTVVKEGLSVRDTERLAARLAENQPQHRLKSGGTPKTAHIADLESRLTECLGTKVTIQTKRKGGKLVISFFDNDAFEALMDRLMPSGWRA
ncbi:MAG TPA: ParB/RepB/Spo0J family partition protein [Candidatus Brocadiia bacterium]|nr:ParB/RepB/Spo0J family partition protein [Candidatus Brocadiia bacterium]